MSKLKKSAFIIFMMPMLAAAQSPAESPDSVTFGPGQLDSISLVELNKAISTAPSEQMYSVQMVFDEPVRVDKLRETASYLKILRLLAFVEYGPTHPGHARAQVFVGLGTLYEGEQAWAHETCRARLFAAAFPDDALLRIPAEEWLVKEIHVYGAAHAVRELRSGTFLPSATITDGAAAGAANPQAFISHVKDDLAKKIQVPDNSNVPEECWKFAERYEAPILTGQSMIQSPAYGNEHDPNFRSSIHQLLGERAPNTPVTLQITLNFDATLEEFASLVDEYDIDGLLADLEPADAIGQLMMPAELSIHGASLEDQVRSIRCQMRFGAAAEIAGEWYADRADVSVSVSKAWRLVSYQNLVDARLITEFEPGALKIVEAYHQGKASEIMRVPPSYAIPSGCSSYIQHEN